MKIFMILGWGRIVPGYGRTSTLSRAATPAAGWLHQTKRNQQSTDGGGVFTSCGAVSIQGSSVFVPDLLDFWMYGRSSDPGMGHDHLLVGRDLGVVPRRNSPRWIHKPSRISNQPVGLTFPHRETRYRSGACSLSLLGCWGCIWEEILTVPGWDRIVIERVGGSTLSLGSICCRALAQ